MSVSTVTGRDIDPTEEDKQFASQQLIDLRLNQYLEINEAEKVNDQLYKVAVSGMSAKAKGGLLYKGSKGSWILMLRTDEAYHEFIKIHDPVYFFTTQEAAIQMDNTTPAMVKTFLQPYKQLGTSIPLDAGATFAGIWYPKEVASDAAALINMVGLSGDEYAHGLQLRGTYNYLASGNIMMNMVADLGALPTIQGQPAAFKMSQQNINLGIGCNLTASFDFIKTKSFGKFDESDCELKIGTEVRVDVNSDHVLFDAAIGFRSIKRANSRAANEEVAKRAKILGFDPNKSSAVFIEGDIRGGVWKNIFGLQGFDMQEVKLQTLIDKETGWHIGIFGQIDFGTETRMTAAALIPVGSTGESFSNIALEASLDKLTLEELAMLPSAIGGPQTYPKDWTSSIKGAGLNHFALQNAKFTFAPSISDPDLGIDQSGTTVTGSLIAFGQIIGSLKVYANQSGIYFDDAVEPFKIGWFELKNARFKGFIPSKNQKNSDGSTRARKKLDYVGQNAFVLFFDTFMEIDGNKERALVSFTLLNAGIEFEVNITKEFGMGFKMGIPVANMANAQYPFDVSSHINTGTADFSKEIRKMISDGIQDDINKTDKTYQAQIDDIKKAQENLNTLKKQYDEARAKAQARVDKALAPLKKAESVLSEKNSYEEKLHHDYEHWKSKAKHTSWLHPKDKIHAYWEEGKYWSDYEGYKGVVEAARAIVESLKKTTVYISVDADPDVVESFSAYNGAKFALAIAKGALTATKKADDYVGELVKDVLDESFKGLEITDVSSSGTSAASGKFDLTFTMSGKLYGDDWDIKEAAQLYSPKEVGGFFLALQQPNSNNQQAAAIQTWDAAKVAAQNMKVIAESLNPMSQSMVAYSKSKFHGADYAQYPPGQLAYEWKMLPGEAVDIAAGVNTVYVNNSNGYIYKWNQQDSTWNRYLDASDVRHIAARGSEDPILVTNDGRLWFRDTKAKKWIPDPNISNVHDAGIGEDGTIWVTTVKQGDTTQPSINWNTSKNSTVDAIWRKKSGSKWEKMPGAALRVDVDEEGNAWVINQLQQIFRWTGSGWERIVGAATDVGVGGKNVWVVNNHDYVYHFIPGTKKWVRITGLGENISVDNEGDLWLVNKNGNIFKNLGPR